MKAIKTFALCGLVVTGMVSGCATSYTEQNFGNSVRSVMSAQIHDQGAALYPSDESVTGGDSNRLENVVNAHRSDVADPKSIRQMNTSISGSGGRR